MQITQNYVKNYDEDRFGYKPSAIVIHSSDKTTEEIISQYNDPESEKSTHYLITKDGDIQVLVDEKSTAKANDRVNEPSWKYIKSGIKPDLYTISIQHELDDGKWNEEMYWSDVYLIKEICERWDIPVDRNYIISHNEIDSEADCPTSNFDFKKLFKYINKYEDKMKELEDQIEKLNETITSLEEKASKLIAENEGIKSDLEKERSKSKEKETKISELTSKLEKYTKKTSSKASKITQKEDEGIVEKIKSLLGRK